MASYAIIGAGGFGRELFSIAAQGLADDIGNGKGELVFVVEDGFTAEPANGHRILALSRFLADMPRPHFFAVAIADSRARERITRLCLENGMAHFDIRSPWSAVMEGSSLGEGAIMAPFSLITANSRVGRSLHLNYYACITHDCVIGDFVTFAPRAHCNGSVVIEDHAFIGAGAIIKQGTSRKPIVIGAGAIVGMGAVVTRDVAPNAVVVGNPARLLAGSR